MGPLGLPFGTLFWFKTVIGFESNHFLGGCSPQSAPKPPKAAPRTPPGHPGTPLELPGDLPGSPNEPPGLPPETPKPPKWFPWAPQVSPRGATSPNAAEKDKTTTAQQTQLFICLICGAMGRLAWAYKVKQNKIFRKTDEVKYN